MIVIPTILLQQRYNDIGMCVVMILLLPGRCCVHDDHWWYYFKVTPPCPTQGTTCTRTAWGLAAAGHDVLWACGAHRRPLSGPQIWNNVRRDWRQLLITVILHTHTQKHLSYYGILKIKKKYREFDDLELWKYRAVNGVLHAPSIKEQTATIYCFVWLDVADASMCNN